MGKIEDKKLHKREKLLETALSLFLEKGLNKTSISDITTNAGVAKGTFYLYFRDKYDLRKKLIVSKSAELFDHAIEKLERSGASCFEDQMIILIDDIINQLAADTAVLKFINKNLSMGMVMSAMKMDADAEHNDYMTYLSDLMRKTPDVEWKAPHIMLFSVVELVSSTCYSVILGSNPVDLAHFKPYLYNDVRSIIKNHEVPLKKKPEKTKLGQKLGSLKELPLDRLKNQIIPSGGGSLRHA